MHYSIGLQIKGKETEKVSSKNLYTTNDENSLRLASYLTGNTTCLLNKTNWSMLFRYTAADYENYIEFLGKTQRYPMLKEVVHIVTEIYLWKVVNN
jgi:hypothetical protein